MLRKKVLNKKETPVNKTIDPIWAILALGTLLRVFSINQSLWLDEATTATVSKLSFIEILTQFSPKDFHPPLYYFLSKISALLFGYSEIAMRLPSVLAGVATIYVIYLIGKKIFSTQTGMVAALLASTSPLLIYYSQEARMYMPATLLVTLLVYFWYQATTEKHVKWWTFFSLTAALTIGMDYLSVAILVPLALLTIKQRKNLKPFIFALLPAVFLFLLFLPVFVSQIRGAIGVHSYDVGWWKILGVTTVKSLALVPVKFLIGRISFTSHVLYGFVVLSFLGLVSYLVFQARRVKKAGILFSWLTIPIICFALLGLFVPVFVYFRLIFCLPALYLLAARGLFQIKEDLFLPLISFFLLANLICTYMYLTNPQFQREDWRGLTQTITVESKEIEAETVFVNNSQMEGYRYYNPSVPVTYGDAFDGGVKKVWLMRYVQDVFDPSDAVRQKIENLGYSKSKEYDFNGIVVWEYNFKEVDKQN